ncbi:MAG: NnrU family protein [Alphaproteobacteria bacterium]|nr:NnrU family protein [Alphaproteobacteria bacterium]
MSWLVLAALIWTGVHVGVAGSGLRATLARRFGERGFLAGFSVLSVAAIAFLILAYRHAPTVPLWFAPPRLRDLLAVVMLLAFVLFVGAVSARNPTMVGGEDAEPAPVAGMQRITRHPMLWSFALWAGVHVLGRGTLDGLLFFGAFLVTALAGMPSIDAKLAARRPSVWAELARTTSIVPFGAILAARNRFVAAEIGWITPVVAIVLWVVFLGFLHRLLFGLSPIGG